MYDIGVLSKFNGEYSYYYNGEEGEYIELLSQICAAN